MENKVVKNNPEWTNKFKLESGEKARVAAYFRCDNSPGNEYESKAERFEGLINDIPHWKFAGIYSDEGRTIENLRNETDLKRLFRDCENNKIDFLIMDCASDFAPSASDVLKRARILSRNNVYAYFLETQVDTMSLCKIPETYCQQYFESKQQKTANDELDEEVEEDAGMSLNML